MKYFRYQLLFFGILGLLYFLMMALLYLGHNLQKAHSEKAGFVQLLSLKNQLLEGLDKPWAFANFEKKIWLAEFLSQPLINRLESGLDPLNLPFEKASGLFSGKKGQINFSKGQKFESFFGSGWEKRFFLGLKHGGDFFTSSMQKLYAYPITLEEFQRTKGQFQTIFKNGQFFYRYYNQVGETHILFLVHLDLLTSSFLQEEILKFFLTSTSQIKKGPQDAFYSLYQKETLSSKSPGLVYAFQPESFWQFLQRQSLLNLFFVALLILLYQQGGYRIVVIRMDFRFLALLFFSFLLLCMALNLFLSQATEALKQNTRQKNWARHLQNLSSWQKEFSAFCEQKARPHQPNPLQQALLDHLLNSNENKIDLARPLKRLIQAELLRLGARKGTSVSGVLGQEDMILVWRQNQPLLIYLPEAQKEFLQSKAPKNILIARNNQRTLWQNQEKLPSRELNSLFNSLILHPVSMTEATLEKPMQVYVFNIHLRSPLQILILEPVASEHFLWRLWLPLSIFLIFCLGFFWLLSRDFHQKVTQLKLSLKSKIRPDLQEILNIQKLKTQIEARIEKIRSSLSPSVLKTLELFETLEILQDTGAVAEIQIKSPEACLKEIETLASRTSALVLMQAKSLRIVFLPQFHRLCVPECLSLIQKIREILPSAGIGLAMGEVTLKLHEGEALEFVLEGKALQELEQIHTTLPKGQILMNQNAFEAHRYAYDLIQKQDGWYSLLQD